MGNASDEKELKKIAKKQKKVRLQQLSDIKFIMESAQGRRTVARLLEEANIFKTSTRDGFGTNTILFNEGLRHVGLFLLGEITEECGDLYLKMLNENR